MLTELGTLVYNRLVAEVDDVEVWAKRQEQEGTKPSIVYDIQLGPRGKGTAEVAPILLIVSCYASTSDAVEEVAAAVVAALQDWSAWDAEVAIYNCEQTNAQQDVDDAKGVFYAVLSFSATAVL